MKKLITRLFSRVVVVGILLALQALVLVILIWKLSNYFGYIQLFFTFLSFVIALILVASKDKPSTKMAWLIPILLFPIFGGLFYLMFGTNKLDRKLDFNNMECLKPLNDSLIKDDKIYEEINDLNSDAARQVNYIENTTGFPVYKNTTSKYLSPGEKFFDVLKEELEKAQHYIFMEYFIIAEGKMWDELLEILVRKAKEGLDVRVMYDDVGSVDRLPFNYYKKLNALGIKTVVFNPYQPILNIRMNNRDHRKITVIDGHTAFTGGINLGDEYINHYEKHGHWKDAAVMIKGDAVYSFTMMFLQFWNGYTSTLDNYEDYKPHKFHEADFINDGYYLPFSDQPFDEASYESAYIQMINHAKKYIYINTPYLICGSEILTALTLAAKSGVEVIIVTPHIGDKWYVHTVTRSFYRQLVEQGVKIYEYEPGFIHSKTYVCDDELGFIGTTNMDFRSFYLHYECGVWMYKAKAVTELRDDFLETLKVCKEITLEDIKRTPWYTKMLRLILNMFAPLM